MWYMHIGKNLQIAIILTCPRQPEFVDNRAASPSDEIGQNLDQLLGLLSSKTGRLDFNRDDVTIAYAWPNVEYPELTGRSTPTKLQVFHPDNIGRLNRELADISELVICSGIFAEELYPRLTLPKNPKIVCVPHISLRGLQTVRFGTTGPHGKSPLEVIADRIIEKLNAKPEP